MKDLASQRRYNYFEFTKNAFREFVVFPKNWWMKCRVLSILKTKESKSKSLVARAVRKLIKTVQLPEVSETKYVLHNEKKNISSTCNTSS